jgi:hypothetical protein
MLRLLAGVDSSGGAHTSFRGAGGHSAGRCNWFPTDIGIVGSASCGPPTRSPPAAPPPVVRCGESARQGVARERMLERQSESSQ